MQWFGQFARRSVWLYVVVVLNVFAGVWSPSTAHAATKGRAQPAMQRPRPAESVPARRVKASQRSQFRLPATVQSAKGVSGRFSVKKYAYRIDTNKSGLAGKEQFHIHVTRQGKKRPIEVAKINERGGFTPSHGRRSTLVKASVLPKQVRKEINRLVRHVQKNLPGFEKRPKSA